MRSSAGQRIFDLIVSIILLIVLSPLLAAVMIWIKLDSRGPIFFVQQRVGRFGRRFQIYKFRTMVAGAENHGAQITIGVDPRVTRSGRLLRKYRIDEFPQLVNVLKGEMSIVGPRPEVPRYVEFYSQEQKSILDFRPGLTSPASISFSNESLLLAEQSDPERFYRDHLIPAKIEKDLTYAREASFLSDCAVLIRTLRGLLRFS